MKVQHTNYCRQMVKTLLYNIENFQFRPIFISEMKHAMTLASQSVKFIIPTGGRALVDSELRGLGNAEVLHLPFPVVALEYADIGTETERPGKHIVFIKEEENELILVTVIDSIHSPWSPTCVIRLPRRNYLTSRYGVKWPIFTVDDPECPDEVAAEPAIAALCFLNALSCSNVKIERSEAKQSSKKINDAHAFDSYHILTIDTAKQSSGGGCTGGHRSPREHLRRGHIRRLDDRKIWVNATVVGAGAVGKVIKDYKVT